VHLIVAYTSNSASRIPIGFTTINEFQAYLPSGDPNAQYALQIVVEIRDTHGAISSCNISNVKVNHCRLFNINR
jgi:hypothetical protein